jgi:hypothetical protein
MGYTRAPSLRLSPGRFRTHLPSGFSPVQDGPGDSPGAPSRHGKSPSMRATDTTPEAHAAQLVVWRRLGAGGRSRLTGRMSESARDVARAGIVCRPGSPVRKTPSSPSWNGQSIRVGRSDSCEMSSASSRSSAPRWTVSTSRAGSTSWASRASGPTLKRRRPSRQGCRPAGAVAKTNARFDCEDARSAARSPQAAVRQSQPTLGQGGRSKRGGRVAAGRQSQPTLGQGGRARWLHGSWN